MPNKTKGNLAWGTSTWIFLHWFAENINEVFYSLNNKIIIRYISDIFNSLPCPTCKNHAQTYMKKYNINLATTKELLKLYLFRFHNAVNARKGVKIEENSILEEYQAKKGIEVLKIWNRDFINPLGVVTYDFMNKSNITKCKQNMIRLVKTKQNQFTNLF